jgi:dTDP-4-dehydrorhamnose 3,5-epimerase
MSNPFPRIERSAGRREDARGYLEVLYESENAVLKRSFTRKHGFRGMHWQDESAPQVKIFRIVSGAIVDFLVPMNDPARPIYHEKISPEDGWVRIDAHYAHGLFALEDSVFEYFCDGGYDEAAEVAFSITEHIKQVLGVEEVILSAKDQAAPPLSALAVEPARHPVEAR